MTHDPCDDPINECWSCRTLFADDEGFPLTEDGEPVCCRECWEKMSVFERLTLCYYVRPAKQGGAGLVDLFRVGLSAYPFSHLRRPSDQ